MVTPRIPVLPNNPPKPYIRPKAKAMTIAAAFKCKDGVVLAADTQISHWQSYSYESKVIDLSSPPHWRPIYMAYAGDVGLMKEITEVLQSTVSATDKPENLAKNLKKTFKELHKENFSQVPRAEKTEITALVSFADSEENWHLYCAWGNKFFPVDQFLLLGMGTDTGNAVLQPLFSDNLSVQETAVLAAYGLKVVKRFVKGCGGDSEIWMLTDDMFCAQSEKMKNVEQLEKEFLSLEKVQSKLIASLWAFDSSNTFAAHLKNFRKAVSAIRKRREKVLVKELKTRLQKLKTGVSLPT